MVKRLTRSQGRVRNPETEGWRFAFVQRCYTRGMHTQETLTACEQSGLFDVVRRRPGVKRPERRPLSRQRIKVRYLTPVRKRLRAEGFNATEERRLAYSRYLEAYRYALAQERPKDMVAAVRGMATLLGLEQVQDNQPIDIRVAALPGVVRQLQSEVGEDREYSRTRKLGKNGRGT